MAVGAELVDAPLSQWTASSPARPAIIEGGLRLSFAALERAVADRARSLDAEEAPQAVLVSDAGSTAQRLVDFLGIVRSGRCAAVADPEWPPAVRERVLQHLPRTPVPADPPDGGTPFYIGYTSGSTGQPKGFLRDHRSWVESFRACRGTFGPAAAGPLLAPGGMSHSLFLFGMLFGLWTGGGIVVQPRFSAARAWASLRDGQASVLVAVPSQLLVMLEHARRRALPPLDGVRLVMISGARWMRQHTPALRALLPQARIVEFYGASETSFIAWMDADEQAPADAVGRPFATVQLDIRHQPSDAEAGLIFVRSPMLFTGYVGGGDDPTAALRDGDWLSVRDMGWLDDAGRLRLAGRQNRMIVTSGKNLFPEEVEAVLATFPGLSAASVQALPDEVRGAAVVALIPASAGDPPTAAALAAWCRQRLDAHKIPRRFLRCDDWPLTAGGKTDHAELARRLRAWAEGSTDAPPCLRPLP